MTIKAGGKEFKTKASLTNYCKYVLNNATLNTVLHGEWGAVLRDVLSMHESFEEKTDGQSFEIGVRQCFINPRNRQFFILREDGSDTDFSFYKAISTPKKPSYIKATLRAAVKDQTVSFKEDYFAKNADSKGYVRCADTNLKIKQKDAHVDHFPLQFDEIVKEWVDIIGKKSEDIVLLRPERDNKTVWEMEDKELLNSFVEFHKTVATYRVVLNKVNQQRKKAKKFEF